ncbi:MAG: hypothetical protein FWE12_02285 [Oscillospiraceae bacterium]|nr:hypothetical protein [Oscillospiraceae bacterium]
MFNVGLLLILCFSFIAFSALSAAALFAVAIPMSRGLEYFFAQRLPWRRSTYIAALSALILTAAGTYAARLFIVVSERLRFAGLDPFPGDIEVLLVEALVNTMFVLIAVGVAAFRLRNILRATDPLEPRGSFNAISILAVLSFFNFTQTMLMAASPLR